MAIAMRQYLPLPTAGKLVGIAMLVRACTGCLRMIESGMHSTRPFIAALCVALLAMFTFSASVNAGQDARTITKAIDDFLIVQTRGLPGTASYTIGAITATDRLNRCDNLQIALPQGGRLWGKTNLVVRCEGPQQWTLYVPVKIRVIGNYLVSSRALRQGQVVSIEDVAALNGDLTELPTGTLTDTQQALGRTVAQSVAAGYPLRSDLIRQPLIIRQGQTVKIVSRGAGFEVTNEGEALNNAAQGQLVRIRLGSGQLVSGIADSNGSVVVAN